MPQLPALQLEPRNALLDLTPVNNALMGIQRQQNANRDYAMQQDELAMRKQTHDLQAQNYQRQWKQQDVENMGKRAMAIDAMADGPQKEAAWQRIVQSHGADGLSPEELDYRTGPKMMAAQAGLFRDPMDVEAKRLDMAYKRAQIAQVNRKSSDNDLFAQRSTQAQALGIDPNSDSFKSYVLTGKLPREDQQSLTATDKKAILEADDMVGTNRSAIQAIDEALRLNPKANAGWGAGARASAGANLPDLLVPDFISSPESSQATIDFDNAIIGQALTSLKAIFGGNPTEGERKILLDLQGSSGKPMAVREEILQRARRAAVSRLSLNEQRASELRGGTFYKPGGGTDAAKPQAATVQENAAPPAQSGVFDVGDGFTVKVK